MKQLGFPETTSTRKIALPMLAAMLLFAATTANSQTFTDLYNLGTNANDPNYPSNTGLFAQGRDGNLYSTSQSGGASNQGTVFQLTPAGKMTVIHSFTTDDGPNPGSGLTLGTDGSLYGTGGSVNGDPISTVFKITTSGKFTVIHTFDVGTEGTQPKAPPIQGSDGNFYGTTVYGPGGGPGMVYKMTPKGRLTVLHKYVRGDGFLPVALTQGTDGNFYGTALSGGTGGAGVVFKITSRGKYTVLYNFDGTHGQSPNGPIIQASDGDFYGTTQYGGTDGWGVVYKMTPSGALSTIFNFLRKDQGTAKPLAGLVQGTDGKFYGGTRGGPNSFGQLFQVTSKGKYTVLYSFKHPPTTGAFPNVSLFQQTNGTFYSDTYEGGTKGKGVLYSLKMGLGPFVRFVGPLSSGKVGNTIQILGQGFTGTTNVSFNGVSAIFSVVSDTYLTATVPDGATSGSVAVKTPGGTLTSNKVFRVTPAILSFNPTSGPVGTPVTIVGTSFTGAKKITFGGVKATVFSVDSDQQITATVPTGAKTGKIQVTTPGGTATSSDVFTVTQ